MEYIAETEEFEGFAKDPKNRERICWHMVKQIVDKMEINDLIQLFNIQIEEPKPRDIIKF